MSRTGHRTLLRIALPLFAAAALPLSGGGGAEAFLPAGQDQMGVYGAVTVASRLGTETIALTGTVTIQRSEARDDGGVSVVDLEIVELSLLGASVTGPVAVTESAALASFGEIRSQQPGQDYPATSHIDAHVVVAHAADPGPTQSVHNDLPARIVPVVNGNEQPLTYWPPVGLTFAVTPDPCLPLLPSDPKEVCVTSLWVTFEALSGVGGVSELASLDVSSAAVAARDPAGPPWALIVVALVALAAGVAAGGASALAVARRRA